MRTRHRVMAALCAALAGPAGAVYDNNVVGQIESFWSYADGDYIYFKLKNQPTSHNGCNPAYFVIPGTVPADRRKMMFARLTLAYATQEAVNIGFAANGDCASTYINVYRVG